MKKGLHMKYFVVKPAGADQYAYASRAALRAYAKELIDKDDALAKDLLEWAQWGHLGRPDEPGKVGMEGGTCKGES
jgi:hypothetical protein